MELGISGLASGFDWRALVDQLADVERAPQRRLRAQQNLLEQRRSAYSSIMTQLSALNTRIETLRQPTFFTSRLAQSSDSTSLSATVAAGAMVGTYTFDFVQLATASTLRGAPKIAAPLSPTNDVSDLILSEAGFTTAITAGTFSVNGKTVSIETSDTLQEVFDKVSAATGGTVTGSYDAATDRILLSSGNEIVLGTATDSSNFLQAARLHNNGTGELASSSALGGIKTTTSLANANFAATLTDGGDGNGEFKINGVSISFNTATDSLTNVIERINNSAAGVTASYDSIGDRVSLANKSTGDIGIAFEDVTGNFLETAGILEGALQRGRNLIYTVNGGTELTSHSNTITETGSGIAGLSVTALKEGPASVTVSSDTEKLKTAILDFIEEYNKAQSLIESRTASSTDSSGKVTAGILSGDRDAGSIASQLRSLAFAWIPGEIKNLADLGITTSGTSNQLTVDNEEKLAAALESQLSAVESLFTDPGNGLAVKLANYLERTVGDDGTLQTRQGNITRQTAAIDVQIADLERQVQANRQRMITSFLAMEQAQARVHQQLQFLQQRFNNINQPA